MKNKQGLERDGSHLSVHSNESESSMAHRDNTSRALHIITCQRLDMEPVCCIPTCIYETHKYYMLQWL